ncbi:MAG: phosphoribosyl-ATP diphosphatase [Treponema sp.]|jgi:phosphoribosyl-ATP pyrophosphohydrolase/phosphoribosyl-AMP cyclohydrolase|nr:phosphoribosyl-ATP diphosphatase [Treponema sp.]
MVIASIDIQNGKVVQLRQGRDLVLQRDDGVELAETFDRYGEVAVIDLDAAMGLGSNLPIIKPLLRKAACRMGGGIKTVEQARELVSLGAQKLIIGSQAFRDPLKAGEEFTLNTDLLQALVTQIGRERIIIAVDARKHETGDYEIVVNGWKTPTGLPLIETAQAVESFAGELLFTCVDREGTMNGIDLAGVRRLREAIFCRLTVAGGVSTLEEIEALAALDCDVQLGMALYTGNIDLGEAFIRSLNWKKGSSSASPPQQALLPLIAQSSDGQVLMTGFADQQAVAESFIRGKLCFHSRTQNSLWMKGEHSGNTLTLRRLRADCDRDALLAVVEPAGPVCHTGDYSCFETGRRYTWEYLQAIIADRFRNPSAGSYTATLDDTLVREKILEEAEEVCTAKTHAEVVWEAADLVFFTTALMTREGVTVAEVLDELDRRHKK